jgi:hypothetical protein
MGVAAPHGTLLAASPADGERRDLVVAITPQPSVITLQGNGELRRRLQRVRPGTLCPPQHLVYTFA